MAADRFSINKVKICCHFSVSNVFLMSSKNSLFNHHQHYSELGSCPEPICWYWSFRYDQV